MAAQPQPYVHEAELRLAPGTDPRAPGGEVTVALCGSWDHEGACRWPHNTSIREGDPHARVRTVFVAPPSDEADVRARIERALRADERWEVAASGPAQLEGDEAELAAKLARPRP